jgi:hypothetical protein
VAQGEKKQTIKYEKCTWDSVRLAKDQIPKSNAFLDFSKPEFNPNFKQTLSDLYI